MFLGRGLEFKLRKLNDVKTKKHFLLKKKTFLPNQWHFYA